MVISHANYFSLKSFSERPFSSMHSLEQNHPNVQPMHCWPRTEGKVKCVCVFQNERFQTFCICLLGLF